MNWLLMTIIVLIVLINFVLPFFIKGWFKKILYTALLSLIVFGVLGFFVWQDLKDLKDNFPSGRKLFLMKSNDNYIAGIVIRELTNEETTTYVSEELLVKYKNFSLSEIKDEHFKVFIMEEEFFKPTDAIDISELTISKEKLLNFLYGDNTIDSFIDYFIEQSKESSVNNALEKAGLEENEEARKQLEDSYDLQRNELSASIKADLGVSTNTQMRGLLFSLLMFETLNKQEQTYLLEQFQKGSLVIYPETIIFNIVKLVPLSAVKDKIGALT